MSYSHVTCIQQTAVLDAGKFMRCLNLVKHEACTAWQLLSVFIWLVHWPKNHFVHQTTEYVNTGRKNDTLSTPRQVTEKIKKTTGGNTATPPTQHHSDYHNSWTIHCKWNKMLKLIYRTRRRWKLQKSVKPQSVWHCIVNGHNYEGMARTLTVSTQ